jgi:hypothetical protein
MAVAKFSVGSDTWPGAAKAAEEAAEFLVVLMKLIAVGGEGISYSGAELRPWLSDEFDDLRAAMDYLGERNGLPVVEGRRQRKLDELWRADKEARVIRDVQRRQ